MSSDKGKYTPLCATEYEDEDGSAVDPKLSFRQRSTSFSYSIIILFISNLFFLSLWLQSWHRNHVSNDSCVRPLLVDCKS